VNQVQCGQLLQHLCSGNARGAAMWGKGSNLRQLAWEQCHISGDSAHKHLSQVPGATFLRNRAADSSMYPCHRCLSWDCMLSTCTVVHTAQAGPAPVFQKGGYRSGPKA
jgi:hypothetical protein